jgi:hypothetical protein
MTAGFTRLWTAPVLAHSEIPLNYAGILAMRL